MSKIHNFSNLQRECQEITESAVSRIDSTFVKFVSITKFCILYFYDANGKTWKESVHEGPLYLYISQISPKSEEKLCFLLHNHKSRENFKQIISKNTVLKVKETRQFLVINNETVNMLLWFSFPADRRDFIKCLKEF